MYQLLSWRKLWLHGKDHMVLLSRLWLLTIDNVLYIDISNFIVTQAVNKIMSMLVQWEVKLSLLQTGCGCPACAPIKMFFSSGHLNSQGISRLKKMQIMPFNCKCSRLYWQFFRSFSETSILVNLKWFIRKNLHLHSFRDYIKLQKHIQLLYECNARYKSHSCHWYHFFLVIYKWFHFWHFFLTDRASAFPERGQPCSTSGSPIAWGLDKAGEIRKKEKWSKLLRFLLRRAWTC